MRESLVRSLEFGVRRKKLFAPNYELSAPCLLVIVALCALSLSGCVRVAGTAGYAKINSNGETAVKQTGFDTANLAHGSPAPGSITV